MCISQQPQMRLALSPPWIWPRFKVGYGILKCSTEYLFFNSSLMINNFVIILCMTSMAFKPRSGSELWPERPITRIAVLIWPL